MPTTAATPTSAQHRPAAAKVLDARALAELRALDPLGSNRLMQRVFRAYQVSLAGFVLQLREARAGNDDDGLRLAAHTLKSSSASVGALDLARLCSAVEHALQQDPRAALPALLDRLELEAAGVGLAVQLLLQSFDTPRHP